MKQEGIAGVVMPILTLHDSYASFVDGSSVTMLYLLNGSFMMLLE